MGFRDRSVEDLVMAITEAFWRGKRVLVTGHTGFKGGWLALWLREMGAEVTGLALQPSTSPNLFEAAGVGEGIRSIIGDIRDLDLVTRVVREADPQVVFHMAAQPLVRYSYHHPVETYMTNVMGTVHLLEAVRQHGKVEVFVSITSDKCYENKEWPWGYRENDPMGGHDPYSNSKGCSELVTAAYRNSYFGPGTALPTRIASVRAGNVIGGGDWSGDRLVPDAVRAFGAGEVLTIRSPRAVRPWQHVFEPLSGYLTLAERVWSDAALAEGWNFGPRDADTRTVAEVIDMVQGHWGAGARWADVSDQANLHEAHLLKLDCSKARAVLGWQPVWSLEQGIEATVDWYVRHLRGEDMRAVSLRQLQAYRKVRGGRID